MKNVVVIARAADDLEDARHFYEAQAPGLGQRCTISVLASLTKLSELSGVHAQFGRYHRMIEKTYHLGIYYREAGEDTLVLAILDLRRDPNWIRKQLQQRPNL
ncbi:MAG: type II toxin-antitoxin system RelE/ParE family toxin [Chthoniobacterales bacterium]